MAEPAGLGMSLDDLIKKQQQDIEVGNGGYGKQRRGGQQQAGGGRVGGRGGARGGRGGGGGRGQGGDRMDEEWSGAGAGGMQRQPQQQMLQQQHQPVFIVPPQFVMPHFPQQQMQQQMQQQQQPQQRQQQQRRPQQQRGHQRQHQRQRDPTAYRNDQKCVQLDTGEVVFSFRKNDLVCIDAAGNITLSSGGRYDAVTLASLNDALNLLGIRVTCPSGDAANGDWSISDGRSLTRFADGVMLAAKGPQHAGRGRQMLQAFNNPHHAQQAAAAAASNAAATAAGILPFTGFVPPGVPASRARVGPTAAGGSGGGARPSVFARLGGKTEAEQQTRYAPY